MLVVFTLYLIISSAIILTLLLKNYSLNKRMAMLGEVELWHRLAVTDDLTGIYNRTAYTRHLEEMTKYGEKSAGIILFDIDNFKKINDTEGHLAGDKVLQRVAVVLKRVFVAPEFSIYRIGGDEFAVIGENIDESEIIRLLVKLRDRYERDGTVRLSKGYAIIDGDTKAAFADADKMLYADKVSKKKQLAL